MIYINALNKKYGNQTVLDGINLHIRKGEVISIIGPSGGGKSTLIRCIAGLEYINGGSIEINGIRIDAEDSLRKRSKIVSKIIRDVGIGYVSQRYNLFNHFKALKNIMFALVNVKKTSKEEARKISLDLIERFNLSGCEDKYPSQLSGGQQQRIAIARASALKPQIILLDEITSALDPELVGEVLKVMEELAKEGMTMIAVTHEMSFAEDVANRIIFLDSGKIVEEGEPKQILYNPKHDRTKKFLSRIINRIDNINSFY